MTYLFPLIILSLSCLLPLKFLIALDERGEEILREVDQVTSGELAPENVQVKMIMEIKTSRGEIRRRELRVWTKNNLKAEDWRLMKFTSPPDVRDVGLLVLSETQMYLYLPEFKRIRRIASHNKRESFVGSDFSYEDLGVSEFSTFFWAELIREEETHWELELKRKADVKKPYSRIKMLVSKESKMPVRLELYDDSGELFKVEEQENSQVGKYWLPTKIIMKNVKKGSETSLEMKEIKVDQVIDEEIFTERFLKRSMLSQ